MDGQPHTQSRALEDGFKEIRRRVIDIDAPGVRDQINAAMKRINASEEEAFVLAEMDLNTAEVWSLIPE